MRSTNLGCGYGGIERSIRVNDNGWTMVVFVMKVLGWDVGGGGVSGGFGGYTTTNDGLEITGSTVLVTVVALRISCHRLHRYLRFYCSSYPQLLLYLLPPKPQVFTCLLLDSFSSKKQ